MHKINDLSTSASMQPVAVSPQSVSYQPCQALLEWIPSHDDYDLGLALASGSMHPVENQNKSKVACWYAGPVIKLAYQASKELL